MHEGLGKAGAVIEAQTRLLESLPGYGKLSVRQQNIIRGSFILQQMIDTRNETGPMTRALMNNMYCHSSIGALENKDARTLEDMLKIPKNYHETSSGYEDAREFAGIEKAVEAIGFPSVILFAAKNPMEGDPTEEEPVHALMHSCLALGRDRLGNIIVWEKMNIGGRYNLVPLKDVHSAYARLTAPDPNKGTFGFFFGVRPLTIA